MFIHRQIYLSLCAVYLRSGENILYLYKNEWMSLNKLALIRYKVLDECFRHPYRLYSLEDLIETVSDKLYELEGLDSGVSKRTIQGDIQLMRSNKLGYNAPIIVLDRKYYRYEDLSFSISNSPISEVDLGKLREIVEVLKHLHGFNYFDEMGEIIAKIESKIDHSSHPEQSFIQFEENKLLRGLQHLVPLYKACSRQIPLEILYKSFKAKEAITQIYYPYLLKEYRNRWFLICRAKKGEYLLTLALDRMESIQLLENERFKKNLVENFSNYYDNVIGVTKNETSPVERVVFEVDKKNAPYVLTKPLHPSQTIVRESEKGMIFQINVVLNYELERELLGFAENLIVHSPSKLRRRILKRLNYATLNYAE